MWRSDRKPGKVGRLQDWDRVPVPKRIPTPSTPGGVGRFEESRWVISGGPKRLFLVPLLRNDYIHSARAYSRFKAIGVRGVGTPIPPVPKLPVLHRNTSRIHIYDNLGFPPKSILVLS